MAEVTKANREAALSATYPTADGALWASEKHWVATGETEFAGHTPQRFLPRVAQAIADAEARGRASAPTVASAELEASVQWLRDVAEASEDAGGLADYKTTIWHLSRIAAALGVML